MAEITGKVKHLSALITVGNFTKKELVIETSEQYPQVLCIEFAKDKADLLNGIKKGQDVAVSVNIRGREWTSPQGDVKYFTTLSGWKIGAPQQQETASATVKDDFEDIF